MAKLSSFRVTLKLSEFLEIEGAWEPTAEEKKASWEMYVELVTRISVADLHPEEGLAREALTSLYSLFESTRSILRQYGPAVAKPRRRGGLSFGHVAVTILNRVLRPLLAKWHPLLLDHENLRDEHVGRGEHERAWERIGELRQAIGETRVALSEYAALLAKVAGVPPLSATR